MDERITNYAIGTLTLALLVSLGFVVTASDTHICRSLELTKECNRLSATGLTCYPYLGTTVGKKYCAEGWEELADEPKPEPEPLTPDEPLWPEPSQPVVEFEQQPRSNIGVQYLCSVDGCVRIK